MTAKASGPQASLCCAALAACVVVAVALPSAASAAFPGKNGPIAFESNRAGNFDIWVMSADGSSPRNLTAGSPAPDTTPAWSPDGRKIVFRSERDDPDGDIFVMDADGSNPRNLTANWPHRINDASFSPDGERIVFDGSDGNADNVLVIDADGGRVEAVTALDSEAHDVSGATVSPDGRLVGFSSTCLLCSPATSNAWVLPFPDPSDSDPRAGEVGPFPFFSDSEGRFFEDFSPDGSTIAFSVLLDEFEIYVVPTASASRGPFTSLTPATQLGSDSAAFSPDGEQIAFHRNGPGPCCDQPGDIWVMNVDGSNPRNLTASAQADDDPAWQSIPEPPTLGKLKRNKHNGTAKLVVTVPGPGEVILAGKGLKRAKRTAKAAGKVKLPVKAKGKAKKRLREQGKTKLKASVTYTRAGGIPTKNAKKVKLVRRR